MNIVEKNTNRIVNSFAGIVLFVVSMAAFYMPYEWRILPVIQQYLTPVRYVCAGLLLIAFFLLYASSLSVFRRNWALFAAAGFTAVLVFSSIMHQGDVEGALGTYGLAGIFLLLNISVFFKVNPKKYLLIAFFLLFAVNIVNTYTVFHYWGIGMWEEYGLYRNVFYSLVGNYNGGIEFVMPMAICGCAYASRYGKWMELCNYAAMGMSLVMAVKCDSLTQIIAFSAILAFMILGDLGLLFQRFARILRLVFQPVILMALDLAVFVSVILINQTNWVARLGIDPDFHNRRHVWNMAMEWIQANPIWGNGQETVAVEASKITGYAHSHSTYLEIAYKTGFVGSVFMLLMLAAVIVAIYRNRHSMTAYILSVLLFVMGMAAVAETYPMVYVMLCLGLIYYIAKTTNEQDSGPEKVRKVKTAAVPERGAAADRDREFTGNTEYRQEKKPVSASAPVQTSDVLEEELDSIGRKVREVQSSDSMQETEGQEDLDQTVHIDETVLIGKPASSGLDQTIHLDETVIIGKHYRND